MASLVALFLPQPITIFSLPFVVGLFFFNIRPPALLSRTVLLFLHTQISSTFPSSCVRIPSSWAIQSPLFSPVLFFSLPPHSRKDCLVFGVFGDYRVRHFLAMLLFYCLGKFWSARLLPARLCSLHPLLVCPTLPFLNLFPCFLTLLLFCKKVPWFDFTLQGKQCHPTGFFFLCYAPFSFHFFFAPAVSLGFPLTLVTLRFYLFCDGKRPP